MSSFQVPAAILHPLSDLAVSLQHTVEVICSGSYLHKSELNEDAFRLEIPFTRSPTSSQLHANQKATMLSSENQKRVWHPLKHLSLLLDIDFGQTENYYHIKNEICGVPFNASRLWIHRGFMENESFFYLLIFIYLFYFSSLISPSGLSTSWGLVDWGECRNITPMFQNSSEMVLHYVSSW